MIAGKKYSGLMVDIWSCGIVLYAMLCGYLPFEDPDTKKLYKKILKGSFELPSFLSDSAKDILKKILNTNPDTRYKLNDIRKHPWYSLSKSETVNEGIIVGQNVIPIDQFIITILKDYQIDPEIAKKHLEANKHNDMTATYYLLLKKLQKEKGSITVSALAKNDSLKNVLVSKEMESKPLSSTAETANTIHPFAVEEKNKSYNVSWLEHYNLNAERLSDLKKKNSHYKVVPKSQLIAESCQNGTTVKEVNNMVNRITQRIASQSANRDIHKKNLIGIPKDDLIIKDQLSLIPEISQKYRKYPEAFAEGKMKSQKMCNIYKKVTTQVRNQQPTFMNPLEKTPKVPRPPLNPRVNLSDYATKRSNRLVYSRRITTGAKPDARLQARKSTADRAIRKHSEGRRWKNQLEGTKVPLTSTIINFNTGNFSLEQTQEGLGKRISNYRMKKYSGVNNYSVGS